MKTKLSFFVVGIICLMVMVILIISCKKDPPKSIPSLSTTSAINITSTTANCGGTITSDGNSPITSRGVCWSTNQTPTTTDSKSSDGSGIGSFTSSITGLVPGATYYVRAYATNSIGTAYGTQLDFNAIAIVPAITTIAITAITATTATSGGNILSDGGAPITARGVCWDITQNPTILNATAFASLVDFFSLNAKTSDGTGIGIFTSSILGLSPGTTYYFRAYATNNAGTSYGNQVIGTTNAVLPTISTTATSNITETTVTSGGVITYDGGSPITARGVCWSTTQNPTIANSKTNNGTGSSSFTSNIIGLAPGTVYYIRAYATNSMGTGYGNQLTLTTLATFPTISTSVASSITSTTALSGGNITSDGGSTVTLRGVCWSTSLNPTISNSKTTNGTGTGTFTSNLTGLIANTSYNVRAYATNAAGTAYGSNVSFTTEAISGSTVTDIDGNVYNTVNIGNQVWMAENLKTTRYRNGSSIGTTTPSTLDIRSETNPKYQWAYDGNESNVVTYGRLYTWYAATDSRNICPSGWHLPTSAEWTTLINNLGGEIVAGGKLKESGTSHWQSPNTGATNSSGFTALPGGDRNTNGIFFNIGNWGFWWSSTESTPINAWNRSMFYISTYPTSFDYSKTLGESVRCIKDI